MNERSSVRRKRAMTKAFRIQNLGCASCAAKMEKKIAALPGVSGARVNFMTQRLTLEADEERMGGLMKDAQAIIRSIEPDATLVFPL